MNPFNYEELEEGYESALDSVSELSEQFSDLADGITDALADTQGNIHELSVLLKRCLCIIRHSSPE